MIKTYLDWLVTLPWNVLSIDQLDIPHARAVLEEDHDLQEVKDRILEFLAVRKLNAERHTAEEDRSDTERLADPRGLRGHSLLCWPTWGGQDQPGPEHRTGPGAQVHTHESGWYARRSGNPRPSPDLHRRHARPHHPVH